MSTNNNNSGLLTAVAVAGSGGKKPLQQAAAVVPVIGVDAAASSDAAADNNINSDARRVLNEVPSSTHTNVPGDEDSPPHDHHHHHTHDPHDTTSAFTGCTDILSVPYFGIEDAVRQQKSRIENNLPPLNAAYSQSATSGQQQGPHQTDSCLTGCTEILSAPNFHDEKNAGKQQSDKQHHHHHSHAAALHDHDEVLSGCSSTMSMPSHMISASNLLPSVMNNKQHQHNNNMQDKLHQQQQQSQKSPDSNNKNPSSSSSSQKR